MERLFPDPKNIDKILDRLSVMADKFGGSVSEINSALYTKGFIDGIAIACLVLVAILCFSRKN